ncbi:MAG: cyclic pyranopterin monophosphate synthase MoaC [Leptospiraceae bacterium]|nr:cyclic pyranopterin monophosphate synthase MoaC [Leptospiraceae bacterium]
MEFSHLDKLGNLKMVDVSSKPSSERFAKAFASIRISKELISKIIDKSIPKGDIFTTAKIAGIQAAKKTSELIPLCHPIFISSIELEFKIIEEESKIEVTASANSNSVTGLEMEALTAVSIASLTIYDMCKAIDKSIVIEEIKLLEKKGGKSGDFRSET